MSPSTKITNPKLRFPEFNDPYSSIRMESILSRVVNAVDVQPEEEYQQIGIRSHGKGLFHKKIVKGVELGNKRVFWIEPDLFIVNIVFAWEQAVSKTSVSEVGMIASHRFPMYKTKQEKAYLDYLVWYFLTLKGKYLLELASPGGAGRNKTLGQSTFSRLKVTIPSYSEQQKIANFLTSVDKKIQQFTEKQLLLQQYKKGIMQKLFSQEIRFKDEQGNDFPDWEVKQLRQIATPIKRKAEKVINNVMTISAGKGFLHQADRFSQIIAGTSLKKYTHIKRNEFAYNRGNSKSFTYGCIYRLKDYDEALVPFVYRSFSLNEGVPEFFEQLFLHKYLDRQLRRLISSSARMDGLLNIGEKNFYKVELIVPNEREQQKIASFLGELDKKIDLTKQQIEQTKAFKKGLLQQMFV